MAGPFYVDSNATGTNAGTSWTNAWTSFWSLPSLAAGEIVYVASNHVEASVAANKTLTGPTSGEPAYVYSCTSGTTTYAAGAQVKTTGGSYNLSIDGSFAIYGVTFQAGSVNFTLAADNNEYGILHSCTLKGASGFTITANGFDFVDCVFDCTNDGAAASAAVLIMNAGTTGVKRIIGGSFANMTNRTGTNACLFSGSGGAAAVSVFVSGMDLSSAPSSCEIWNGADSSISLTLENCKMPATYTLIRAAVTSVSGSISLWNCENADSTSERVAYAKSDIAGTITYSKSVYMTDANAATAADGAGGTQSFSWLMVSENTTAEVNLAGPLTTPWVYANVSSTGSKNLDVYFGAAETLDDGEVWVEFEYLGTAGVEKFSRYSTEKVPAASATTYATTGGTWSGTVTSAYYARAAITVNETGLARARVCVGATSKTIYVNPRLIVS